MPDLVTEDLDALTAEETSPGADSVRGCRCAALPDEAMNELVDGLPESGAFVVGLVRVADEQELRAGRRHMLADVGAGYDPFCRTVPAGWSAPRSGAAEEDRDG